LKPKLKTKTTIVTKQVTIVGSDNPQRYEVYCPRGFRPLAAARSRARPPTRRATAPSPSPTSGSASRTAGTTALFADLGDADEGVYVTESRMASSKSWTISATGVAGGTGGQVTAIAYCRKSRKPLITEVQGAPGIATPAATATSTAPPCPAGRHLIAGGFSAPPSVRVFDGGFRDKNTWTASAASYNGGSGAVTALGYCL
jgi:hypothetical protein